MSDSLTLIGLSGGVDSAVAAALAVRARRRVLAVFLDVGPLAAGCTAAQDRRSASGVAAALGIPFRILDCQAEYRRRVLEPALSELQAGRTPNPDVLCNVAIKFGLLADAARRLGATTLVTGHYARLERGGEDEPPVLRRAATQDKDQSYFLAAVDPTRFASVEFPVGNFTKRHTRRLARGFGLPNAARPDSQGLCFLGQQPWSSFIKSYLPLTPGPIRSVAGELLGVHAGLPLYTIGQRHGHRLTTGQPHMVVAKDLAANALVVSGNPHDLETLTLTMRLHRLPPRAELDRPLWAQVRYRQPAQPVARVERSGLNLRVTFQRPQRAVTPGQLAVLYDQDRVSAAGTIV